MARTITTSGMLAGDLVSLRAPSRESRDSGPEAPGFFRAYCTTWVTAADVLFAKFVLPSWNTRCDPNGDLQHVKHPSSEGCQGRVREDTV